MDSEVGKLDIVINANADKAAREVDRINAKLDDLADRAKDTAQRMAASNKSTVDSFGSISAGVQRMAQSVDNLGQKTDDLLGKQHTAWLAIGAVVGGATQQMIQKVTGFIDRLNAIPDAIDAGFKPLIQSQILANDTMQLSTATLEKQIAIIEKKPVNGAAIVFAEQEIAVDHLAAQLDTMNAAMDRVLSDNHIARWKIIFGKGSTSVAEGTIKSFNDQLGEITYQEQADIHDNLPNSAAQDEKERRAKLDAAHSEYQKQIALNQDRPGVDNSANRRDLQNADSIVLGQIREYQEADRQRAAKQRLDQNEAAQRQKQYAAEAEAAAAKAQADLFKAFEQKRDQLRINGGLSPASEYNLLASSDAAGTPQGQARLGQLAAGQANRAHETISRFTEEQKTQSAQSSIGQLEAMKAVSDVTKLQDDATERLTLSTIEMNAITEKNANALKEQRLSYDLARGSINRHDAAIQMSKLHMKDYAIELDALNQQEDADNANSSLTPEERASRAQDRNKQREKISGEAALTNAADQQEIYDTSIVGSATNALNEFAAAATDASSKIKDFVDSSLGSFNDQVIKSLTTRDHSSNREFRNLGADIFRGAAGKGLGALEGFGIQALGLGGSKKPTGAAGDPLHVVMEDASGGSSAMSILSKLFGGGGSSAGSITSSAVSDVGDFAASDAFSGGATALSDIIPFFGDGGAISAGTLAVVGDKGPELFMPSTAGTIVPNNALGRSSGGMGDMHFNIDARGSHDPAAVAMQVNRAIRSAAPHIAAGAIAAMDDRARRRPLSRR